MKKKEKENEDGDGKNAREKRTNSVLFFVSEQRANSADGCEKKNTTRLRLIGNQNFSKPRLTDRFKSERKYWVPSGVISK